MKWGKLGEGSNAGGVGGAAAAERFAE
jgi:hypothetical protein